MKAGLITKKTDIPIIIYSILLFCLVSASYGDEYQQLMPVDRFSTIQLKNINGNIRMRGWEKAEIEIKASKMSGKDRDRLDDVNIKIEKEDDKVKISPNFSIFKPKDLSINYDILVPEDSNLELETTNGSITVSGIKGEIETESVNGDVDIKNSIGSASVKTINGRIDVQMLLDSESLFGTANGPINLVIGDDFSVPIKIVTVSGPVTVTIPDGYAANLDVVSHTGSVNYKIHSDAITKTETVDKNKLKMELHDGGPLLKVEAVTGKVNILSGEKIIARPGFQPKEYKIEDMEMEEQIKEVPYIEALYTLDPPDIDGLLDDDCWNKAAKIDNFLWPDGMEEPKEPTEAYILWDEQSVYIGVKCYESSIENIAVLNTEDDRHAWNDDLVQIFLDPTFNGNEDYYHIAINAIGAVFDQHVAKAVPEKRSAVESELGIDWDSEGIYETEIREDFWSIEMGIPHSSMQVEIKEGDTLMMNIFRMEQRRKEYSFWSPTYEYGDWPHVPERFGEVKFVSELMEIEMEDEPLTPSEQALTISHISVEGNERISRKKIIKAMKLRVGDIADVDNLSKAKKRLESTGWFEKTGIDLTENDNGVHVVVKVVEKEIISISRVQVNGATVFSKEQLIDYFNLESPVTTRKAIRAKCGLVEKLYKQKGYQVAAVRCSVIANTLTLDIEEGLIDKIEIRGNEKVRTRDITKALDLKTGQLIKKESIDNAVYTMTSRLSYIRSADWGTEKADDGTNIVYINVEEGRLTKFKFDGEGEFNRVHGVQWGPYLALENNYTGSKAYCEFLYGFSSKIWNYRFGVEKSLFGTKNRPIIGIDVHKITDTNDRNLVSDTEHFIAEFILGEAWRDFYQREGYELNLRQKVTSDTEFKIKYRNDEYRSLAKNSDWSLLDRAYADDDWSDEFRWTQDSETRIKYRLEDEKYKPENPPIEEGRMKSVIAEYTIDTRNSSKNPSNGWYNTFSAEWAGNQLGGDFDFSLYKVNIRRYNRLSGNQFLMFRIKAASTDRELSILHPRKLFLGGIGTLRGYPFKEFAGDKMVLINAEYWVMTKWPPGIGIVFFVDSGNAWFYNDNIDFDDLNTDLGIGLQLGSLRVNFASPVRDDEDVDFIVSARIARMF
ncbi:BamA/TamA family outer membrane protein [Candidatus Poribacteria bacterium]|nr:BamA/TamA family outer membrane protein [Candidatus Poribacteria bacterium]